jgi:hypothetical protein
VRRCEVVEAHADHKHVHQVGVGAVEAVVGRPDERGGVGNPGGGGAAAAADGSGGAEHSARSAPTLLVLHPSLRPLPFPHALKVLAWNFLALSGDMHFHLEQREDAGARVIATTLLRGTMMRAFRSK